MDLRVLLTAGVTIFLAELGDKTQLAVFGGVAATRKPVELFLGAMAGFAVATLLAAVAGQLLGHVLPERALRLTGGVLFIVIGLWAILRPESG